MTAVETGGGRFSAARRLTILLPVALALFVGSISSSATPIAAPKIALEFDAFRLIPWFVSSFLLASTIAAPVFGKLGDVHGRKWVSLAALLLFGTTSLLAGFVANMEFMIAVRVLQGFAAGGLMVSSMAMIADIVPPADRAKVHGWLSWVFAAATISGPIAGGLAVDMLSWRWVFWLNVPACLAVGIAIIHSFPAAKPDRNRHFDIKGAMILAVMLTGLVAAAGLGTATPEALVKTGACLLVAALAAFAFTRSQRSAVEPILPLYLFKIPEYAIANAFVTILSAITFVEITYLPLFLQEAMGMTATESGTHLLPLLLGVLGASTLSGQFASKTGNAKIPLMAGCMLMVASMALISTLDSTSPLLLFHLFTAGLGIGMGPAMTLTVPVIQNVVPSTDIGAATASAGMFRSIGGSIGIMVFGSIFSATISGAANPEGAEAFAAANSAVFFAGAVTCTAGVAVLSRLDAKLSRA